MTTAEQDPPSAYRFADLTLNVAERRVTRHGQPLPLKSLDFDLLNFLVESAPKVVNTDVLAEKVWGRHFVSPENVAQRVMLLRQSLADEANYPRYIETVRNKGYRLIPVVQRVEAAGPRSAPRRPGRAVAAAAATLLVLGLALAATYWRGGTSARTPPSPNGVAVLPFENLSPDADDAFFALGMQDEIVSQLTKIAGLRVLAVRPGAAGQRSASDLGRELNAATVLSGSVHYAGGRVRVNVYLTETETGTALWSESYERELRDIFAIQSDIALQFATAVEVKLSPTEAARVRSVPTTVPRARDLYLRARARNPLSDQLQTAIDEVEQALALDEKFKEAWVLDARLRFFAQFVYADHADEHRARSEHAARRAIELDPQLGHAYHTLGLVAQSKRDWVGAESALLAAGGVNLPPDEGDAYAGLHMQTGRFDIVEFDLLEAARLAAPLNEVNHRAVAFVHEERGEWARADEVYDTALNVFKEDVRATQILLNQRMHWLVARNDLAAARLLPIADSLNTAMLASLDMPEQARETLHREYAASGAGNPERRRDIGLWAAHFGDYELAVEALRAAIEEQGIQSVYLWLPQFAPVRRTPEFKTLARDVGFVAYYQQYGWPKNFCEPRGEVDFECH